MLFEKGKERRSKEWVDWGAGPFLLKKRTETTVVDPEGCLSRIVQTNGNGYEVK